MTLQDRERLVYHEPVEVGGLEIVGGAAAPVDDVFVLTLAALLAAPVGQVQVVVHHLVAELAVLKHSVEERLQKQVRHILNVL